MSKKCKGLDGTEEYAYGDNNNPPTKKQTDIIRFIEKFSDSRFKGNKSIEAYAFVGNNHTLAEKFKETCEKIEQKEIDRMLEGNGTYEEFEEQCRSYEEYLKK